MLEVKDIHTYYGTSHIIFGISFEVKEAEAVCLLGRNGAGKTTTFRSIIGLTPPKKGSIRFLGMEIVEDRRTASPRWESDLSPTPPDLSGPDGPARISSWPAGKGQAPSGTLTGYIISFPN